jgi:integrase
MPAARDWEDTIRAALLATGDWEELIANHLLGAVAVSAPPQNAKQLLETLARIWVDKPGGRSRQIQIQSTAALLRWAVAERRLGEDWEPPQGLAVFVGRSHAAKAITTPLEVEHILALVRAIPDARWRFVVQLMAAYGLRPEQLQHLQIRQSWPAITEPWPREWPGFPRVSLAPFEVRPYGGSSR